MTLEDLINELFAEKLSLAEIRQSAIIHLETFDYVIDGATLKQIDYYINKALKYSQIEAGII